MKELVNGEIKLRRFRKTDNIRLAELCNNKKIWDNLRDTIPFPYSLNDADFFIKKCKGENPIMNFAIEYKNELAGCIGFVRQEDVYRMSAELGYWIGEPFWNLGIATASVKMMVEYGFESLNLIRIYSKVFDFNKPSQRVLEKAGFRLEGVLKSAVIKNRKVIDEFRYALINNK